MKTHVSIPGDTRNYWKMLKQAAKALGFESEMAAERYLFPIKAAKRRLLVVERLKRSVTQCEKSKSD